MKGRLRWLVAIAALVAASVSQAQTQTQVRFICQLAPGANASQLATQYQIQLLDTTAGAPFVLYGVPTGRDAEALQLQMQANPKFVFVEDDDELSAPENSGAGKGSSISVIGDRTALYAQNAGFLQQIGWSNGLANRIFPTVVRVGILDTGISQFHPVLWHKTLRIANFVDPALPAFDKPMNLDTNGNGDFDEGVGHGTMVAGIIDQISPQSKFVIAKIADSDGVTSAWKVTKGIAFAVMNGCSVINISMGSDDNITALSDVMDWVEQKQVVVVAPIGNNGRKMALDPADISKVVAVVGLDPFDIKAPFSNWDSKADIAAPATGIKSYWWDGTLGTWSGTSFASPMVAAAAAEVVRHTPAFIWRADRLRTLLETTGDNIDRLNPNWDGDIGVALNFTTLLSRLPRR